MKKIILIILGLTMFSCMQPLEKTSTKQNYVVKGTINGKFDDVIKIEYDEQTDSVEIINNTFLFEGEVSSPKAFHFVFDSITSSEVFYLENDTLLFDIIIDKVSVEDDYSNSFIISHLIGGETQNMKAEISSFLKATPKSKKNRDLIFNKMDSLIKVYPNHDYLGKVLTELSMKQDLLYHEVRGLVSKMNVDELNAQDVDILEKYQEKRRNFQIGSIIPDYELISITSETEYLKSELAAYTLIQFWNSWCKQCKSEQRELLEIYKRFNSEGFEIIGISLDANQEDWFTAVNQTSMPWKSLRVRNGFTGKMPTEMGILDFPQYYLLDQNGRIIEINLNLNELNSILLTLFN
ncbi:redoxin domain-containing protein [Psychroflexus sp. CAK1W]|uniref:thioredoxin-like domain-containing protein n=1 Tax=Psychroflexus curvus TaxID=2873595 RepID=UPI001CCA6256|nr:thioredoxin-like domain-containing protein [Psychroflexus curvus]MBZ9626844.1 redoxin domain-containing protein [Psychroflexus curvus]